LKKYSYKTVFTVTISCR